MDADSPLLDPTEDIGLLCQVVASATSERVLRRLAEAGYDDLALIDDVRARHAHRLGPRGRLRGPRADGGNAVRAYPPIGSDG
jgi:hypothetical protein